MNEMTELERQRLAMQDADDESIETLEAGAIIVTRLQLEVAMTADRDARRILLELRDFHRCPFTNRVLVSPKHDDKTLCECGLTTPAVIAVGHREAPGVHIKKFLVRATADEYIDQQDKTPLKMLQKTAETQ